VLAAATFVRLERAVSGGQSWEVDRRMWADQIDVFAARFRVLTYDLRGFGQSASPESEVPYTHADDLHALLDHLGIERAAVIGLSLGGRIAEEFALTYPDSLSALVLVDAALGGHQFSAAFMPTLGALFEGAREGRLAEAKAGWMAAPLFAQSRTSPDVAARLGQMVDEHTGWGLQNPDPHLAMSPPTRDRLSEITAPTLVIVGEHDLPDFHAVADILAAEIPGAQKVVLPGAGHMANMDAPEAFNEAVLGFLRDTLKD